jgi:hypothetical protein
VVPDTSSQGAVDFRKQLVVCPRRDLKLTRAESCREGFPQCVAEAHRLSPANRNPLSMSMASTSPPTSTQLVHCPLWLSHTRMVPSCEHE